MLLPRAFFRLQLRFAERIAHICHVSLDDALIGYSTFYLSFELGHAFDPAHPTWQRYLAGLRVEPDNVEWTYAFYKRRYTDSQAKFFGCFSYAYMSESKVVRPHFMNRDTSGYGALSKEQMETRLQELSAMFAHIRTNHPEAEEVRGCSWLYNIEAYKRLFPTEYTQNTEVADEEFPFLALWGQFLTKEGQVREKMMSDFLRCVEEQEALDAIKQCFPYLPLRPNCSIGYFYRFYDIL